MYKWLLLAIVSQPWGPRVQHVWVHRSVFFLSILPNPSIVTTARKTGLWNWFVLWFNEHSYSLSTLHSLRHCCEHCSCRDVLAAIFPLSCRGAWLCSNWNARTHTELLLLSWNFAIFIVNILIMHITRNLLKCCASVRLCKNFLLRAVAGPCSCRKIRGDVAWQLQSPCDKAAQLAKTSNINRMPIICKYSIFKCHHDVRWFCGRGP
jgi:hypothetical protein